MWLSGTWATLQPETAHSCDLDDPDNMADL
jgi:hypothetical protein